MLDDFLTRAGLAAVGVAIGSAPLGCVVVWRRMAYFGDATAHAAVLGVAIALALEVPVFAGTLSIALVMALIVARLTGRDMASDMVLGVMSHSALAFGLLAASTVPGARLDLSSYLFGDILAVTRGDLALIWGGALLVVSLMAWRWQRILTATLSPDLAIAAGISPRLERYVLMLALAVVVAVAIKVVGALLIGAMLIIPPAVARGFARTPETMVLWTAAVGFFAAVGGLAAAWELDTPAGPSIVCAAALMFMASLVFRGAISQG